jgi:hypothetical protein
MLSFLISGPIYLASLIPLLLLLVLPTITDVSYDARVPIIMP